MAFRRIAGGPMYYANRIGLADVYADIERFHAEHGYWWEPCQLLKELAHAGLRFCDWRKVCSRPGCLHLALPAPLSLSLPPPFHELSFTRLNHTKEKEETI